MAAKKPPHPLRASEIERFEQNLANWLKLDAADTMYHRFQGILESQITTLQICEIITRQGAVSLLIRMSEARCSGLMKPDTHLGENARHIEVSDDQTTPCFFR